MHSDSKAYNQKQAELERKICDLLAQTIETHLPEAESKFWHAHPVWFIAGNPIVGYGKLKNCVRILFWSGQSFLTPGLEKTGRFKAAELRYTSIEQVNIEQLGQWLAESRNIQWDYKNIVKRKGQLERLS
ncbi:DUF1801 domain-containing protein [Paraglaciecola aestuariivivens]